MSDYIQTTIDIKDIQIMEFHHYTIVIISVYLVLVGRVD